MQVWRRLEPPAQSFQGGAVTIGNFDGCHLGHQALIRTAKAAGGPVVVVITFDPHPVKVLKPELPFKRIFPRADLEEQLPKYGVDLLVILPFTKELARTKAEEFWCDYVVTPFRPKHVVEGPDFAFGHSREGTLDFLNKWCAGNGVQLHTVTAQTVGGEQVSSRSIRELIQKGEVAAVIPRLGRPFYLRGEVGSGAGRGAGIGIPTLNFKPVNEITPAQGVYATFTKRAGKRFRSVTNIGVNPTFGGNEGVKIETHVLGGPFEARGETVDVEFIASLRPEMKFASIEDLKKQIKDDILKAGDILEKYEKMDVVKPGQ